MRRWLLALLLVASFPLAGVLPAVAACTSSGPSLRCSNRITSQTTTTITAAVAAKRISIHGGSICVDGNGVTTGVALQDSDATNLVGTSVVYVLLAGQCWYFPRDTKPWVSVVGAGLGLDIATTVGNGPVIVNLEVIQR